MPTADPITTDRLAAAIRKGMAAEPLLTKHARPVADRLAVLIRKRLPNIPAADTGELMIHLGAFLSDVMTALTDEGESPTSAILIATSAIAIAGIELHNSEEPAAAAADTEVPDDLWWPFTGGADTCYIEHDDGGSYRDCCMRTGLTYVLKLHEQQVRASVAAEQDADVRAVEALLQAVGTDAGHAVLNRALLEVTERFVDRIVALDVREAKTEQQPGHDKTSADFLALANRTHLNYVPSDNDVSHGQAEGGGR